MIPARRQIGVKLLILVNCPLTIDIHSLHHQYRICNIFLLSVSIVPTRAVEGITPNQARMRNRPWCGDDAYALGLGVLVPQGTVGAKAAWRHGWHQNVK